MTPIERMLAIITVLFLLMKVIVLAMSQLRLPPARVVAFFFWPGMRVATFATTTERRRRISPEAGVTFCAGGALFLFARWLAPRSIIAAVFIALPALSLMLHFGIFGLLTSFWRWRGIPAEDLFRAPWRSRSLAEFWSRRWNVAFSDMIAVTVQRPMGKRFGRRAAIIASFFASALLHELAISVPAGGGYGLPSTYFLLHGVLVTRDIRGRALTLAAVIVPLPLVFHPWFVRAIIEPLLR